MCCGAVDLLQRVGVDITGVCGEGTEIGLSDEDGEFLGIAAVGSESEIYSGNAACLDSGSGQLFGSVDCLIHGVTPAVVYQHAGV